MLAASPCDPPGPNPAWQLALLENSLVFLLTSLSMFDFISLHTTMAQPFFPKKNHIQN